MGGGNGNGFVDTLMRDVFSMARDRKSHQIQVILGGNATKQVYINGSSIGSGGFCTGIGIYYAASIIVGDGGTITLVGTGGGSYAPSGIGVIIMGIPYTKFQRRGESRTSRWVGRKSGIFLNITGVADRAADTAPEENITGFSYKRWVRRNSIYLVENSSNPNSSLNFINCVGGSGGTGTSTNFNSGVDILTSIINLVTGSINFTNVVGGTSPTGGNHYGININGSSVVVAPVIIGRGFWATWFGKQLWIEFDRNVGIYNYYERFVDRRGSLGTGSNEYGMNLGGAIGVGDGGILTLVGTGGGIYSNSGANNYGINLAGTLTAGNGGTLQNTINLSGIGGASSI